MVLDIKNLKKHFLQKKTLFSREVNVLKAVDGISIALNKGEVVSVVGESGCGKTTFGRTIARLYTPTSGEIIYTDDNGRTIDVHSADKKALKCIRRDIQVVFQDPYSSLNARWDVKSIIAEPLVVQGKIDKEEVHETVAQLLKRVGLSPEHMYRYPHEFSGGQRQRIGIARALSVKPRVLIADEPVSALDVSVQAQILNLLQDLQEEFGLTYIFIAHDLLVVEYISDRIAVMYLGKVVELCSNSELYNNPLHPYTEALLSAVPIPYPRYRTNRILLHGNVPSPVDMPKGCPFHPRCRYARAGLCDVDAPSLRDIGSRHYVACHLAEELQLSGLQELISKLANLKTRI